MTKKRRLSEKCYLRSTRALLVNDKWSEQGMGERRPGLTETRKSSLCLQVADMAKWDGLEACLGQPKVDNPT
ncbi:ABC transporter G family member 41 [Corchorus olitorius]|uniref:ABC transporter G family member 41 n=1 Tax=Corchorus olitorius TaxID=93759 RepID=A0A1R3KZ20_9ROSI|nr:ABC transporter G family member 41 [Corchorus olitorius]